MQVLTNEEVLDMASGGQTSAGATAVNAVISWFVNTTLNMAVEKVKSLNQGGSPNGTNAMGDNW